MLYSEKPHTHRFIFLSILKNRRIFLSLMFSLFLLPTVFSQEITPNQDQESEILRISTALIQTDVTVLDRQGRFVEGIRPEEFELLIDGKPQTISFFEFIKSAGASNKSTGTNDKTTNEANMETASSNGLKTRRQFGRVVFFFLDDLHLQLDSLNLTRKAISDFIENEMQPEDQVAILTSSGQLGILQQLTSEKAVLGTALKRLTLRQQNLTDNSRTPMSEHQALQIEKNDSATINYFVDQLIKERNLQTNRKQNDQKLKPTVTSGSRGISTNRGGGGAAGSSAGGFENEVRERARLIIEQSKVSTRNTLATIENLVRRSGVNPARKIFFLISDGFSVSDNSDARLRMEQITDAAARAGVVIYSVDSRGLVTGLTNASQKVGFDIGGTVKAINTGAISAAQEPLLTIANQTGGRALIDSNDFSKFLTQSLDETSAYYMLGWQPANETKGKNSFRLIEARIKGRDELTVRVRHGFYSEPVKREHKKEDKSKREKNPLLEALSSLYPRMNLPVFVSAGFTDNPQSDSLLTTSIQLDGSALGGNGAAEKTKVNIIGVIINEEGAQVGSLEQTLEIDFSKMTPIQQRNIVYTHQTSIKPGLYQVRVAAEEEKGKRIGSNFSWVEVPDIKQAGFSIGSVMVGEVPAAPADAQALISASRRMLRSSRLLFQTVIYNSPSAAETKIEMQVFQDNQLIKSFAPQMVLTAGVSDLSRVPYVDELPLAEFAPGNYTLQIKAVTPSAQSSVLRRINFTVE